MPSLPTARVSLKGAKTLRRGTPWLYRTELMEPPATDTPGAVVAVVDPQGNPIGQALYARRSPLAIRLLTRKSPAEEKVDDAFFIRRVEAALAR
ncbi:class I SAM-dependent rRNA methyltransferase, partial [Corallococcus terminator]